jgi:hypothetical protein
MMGFRILRGVGIVFLGAVILTLARSIAGGYDIQLGAVPTVVIVAPFLYWAFRAPPPSLSDEQKLERTVADPRLSAATREEAKRRLDDLRADRS